MLNKVMIIGRLGRDPELRYTQSGSPVATLNVATDESYTDRDGNKVDRTEWHRVSVFQRQAENCANFLAKGSLIYVEGSLQTRKWQDQQGQDRYTTEIKAQRVVEAMIKVGCFDSTGAKRSQLMAVYEKALSVAAADRKQAAAGQLSLFDLGGAESIRQSFVELPDIAEYKDSELLDMEHETLGIYLSGHPLNEYEDVLSSLPLSLQQHSPQREPLQGLL